MNVHQCAFIVHANIPNILLFNSLLGTLQQRFTHNLANATEKSNRQAADSGECPLELPSVEGGSNSGKGGMLILDPYMGESATLGSSLDKCL